MFSIFRRGGSATKKEAKSTEGDQEVQTEQSDSSTTSLDSKTSVHHHDDDCCWCTSSLEQIQERRSAFEAKYRMHAKLAGQEDEEINDHIQWALTSIPKFMLPPV